MHFPIGSGVVIKPDRQPGSATIKVSRQDTFLLSNASRQTLSLVRNGVSATLLTHSFRCCRLAIENNMAHTREQNVFLAKLAEQAERFDGTAFPLPRQLPQFSCLSLEMVSNMKDVARLGSELSVEERNLLSVGYKNVVGARRASWRIVSSIEQKEEGRGNGDNVKLIREYRTKVEEELGGICEDILKVLDEHLIPTASTSEPKVFYLKMYALVRT